MNPYIISCSSDSDKPGLSSETVLITFKYPNGFKKFKQKDRISADFRNGDQLFVLKAKGNTVEVKLITSTPKTSYINPMFLLPGVEYFRIENSLGEC